ncbi:MAG: hypothetical protein ACRDHZ_04885 [Ktedonobacteraceae bacterium]
MSSSFSVQLQRKRLLTLICCFLLLALTGCGGSVANTQGPSAIATSAEHGVALSLAPQPALAMQPTPTPIATATNPITGKSPQTNFPPGATLPTEAQCAASVKRSSFEPRPQNAQANQAVPTAQQIAALAPWGANMGQSPLSDSLRKQISGNFTGTTDEILQWAACKWGIDPNIVRAEAVIESSWKQSQLGDYTSDQTQCPPGTWDGQGCYQSYGILQIKYIYFQSSWPMSRTDTAFSAEFMYGVIRACYEGWTTYLNASTPLPGYAPYHAGDIWGCLGRWFSGGWYNQGAVDYIQKVKAALASKAWLQAGF